MGIEMLKIFIDGEKVSRFPGIGWAVFLLMVAKIGPKWYPPQHNNIEQKITAAIPEQRPEPFLLIASLDIWRCC